LVSDLLDEHPSPNAVYCGMRVLCVGRHAFLSEHFCRYFSEAGAECEPAVGAAEALRKAVAFEPHVVVSDADLITPALLDSWTAEPALANVPVLAVSLTRRPDEASPAEVSGLAAVIYLPGLGTEQAAALLSSLHLPRGVAAPATWRVDAAAPSVHSS
jgi:chemotaxis response regulator CheB